MSTSSKNRVAIIYDGFPHYREGVIEALCQSETFRYYFFCDNQYRDRSIPLYSFKAAQEVIRTRSVSIGPLYIQFGILRQIFKKDIYHCVFLGNPYFLSYWLIAPLLRISGKKVYFWTHGWISDCESSFNRQLRNLFYRLANHLLLYGGRAQKIGQNYGFPASHMTVIGNSLNYSLQKRLLASLSDVSQDALRLQFGLPLDKKIIICTARITNKCRFDLLIEAVRFLGDAGKGFYILFIGEGPEVERLKEQALQANVGCKFMGACYEEEKIAKLYKASDLTVSPGKVGLTSIHSMAYGTPVITHDNFDRQMPEYEVVLPNQTGAFFEENSSQDLASVILEWFSKHPIKPEKNCISLVESGYTPEFQRQAIESALLSEIK